MTDYDDVDIKRPYHILITTVTWLDSDIVKPIFDDNDYDESFLI